MRINKFIAQATGMSRRAADTAIAEGRVLVNDKLPAIGYDTREDDVITLDGQPLTGHRATLTIMFNKPAGYVVSRSGQGSKTIYDLLPPKYHHLKPVGRLDKDSSGLLLLTNDGSLANELTHPRYAKTKVYEVELDKPLTKEDKAIIEQGIQLKDGPSRLIVISSASEKSRSPSALPTRSLGKPRDDTQWIIKMTEGKNRQIRRTFAALGYTVTKLHRTQFGGYKLDAIPLGKYEVSA